jgi:enediyne biosynthesis protein E4
VTPWAVAIAACGGLAALALTGAPQPSTAWPVRFADVAREAGLTQAITYGDVTRKRFIIETNGCGVATIDLDDDGWVDLLTLNGTQLEPGERRARTWPKAQAPRIRLYRNQRNGRFVDATEGSGLDRIGWASSVCAGDVDGDGRVDLFITSFGRNVLYRNLGQGRFEDATAKAGLDVARDRWGSGCSLLDIDRDGDLDLFVANYLSLDLATAPEPGQGANCTWKGLPVNCGPKGLATDTNLLYRNDGHGTFTDVSAASGVSRVTGRYSMTAAAADLDGDGWIDIYVATDSTAAILYRNNRDGTFTDVALPSGVAYNELGTPQAGMGLALGDVDADGALDILKTHFADDIPALYRNRGRGLFEDVATQAGLGVQNRFVQWGAGMPDLDNDGWMDVVYVTGNVYPEIEAKLPQYPHRSPRIVFRNTGSGRFVDVSAASGPGVTTPQSSRGAAFADLDGDGDVDALVMNMNAPPSLLRNELRAGHHWLTVRLEGRRSNRQGIGATVLVTSGGRTQARAVLSQTSYYSVDDLRPSFGLGAATVADRIEVRWPSGGVDVVDAVPADQVVTIRERAR